jgi:hypothetical protein
MIGIFLYCTFTCYGEYFEGENVLHGLIKPEEGMNSHISRVGGAII